MPGANEIDKSKSVLVIDDSSAMRRIMKNSLKQLGFDNIEEAQNTDEAWAKLGEKTFSMILCDCSLPDMSGLDLLRAVRSESALAQIPFVVVTTPNQKQALAEAGNAGATDFVYKPVTAVVLESKIQSILGRQNKG